MAAQILKSTEAYRKYKPQSNVCLSIAIRTALIQFQPELSGHSRFGADLSRISPE